MTIEDAIRALKAAYPALTVDVKHWHGGFQMAGQSGPTLSDYWEIMVYEKMPSIYPLRWKGATLDEALSNALRPSLIRTT